VAHLAPADRAWYLLADPQVLPVIEVAFLNGQEQPSIEEAQADFSVQMQRLPRLRRPEAGSAGRDQDDGAMMCRRSGTGDTAARPRAGSR
jgi:hypothetical protein